MSLWYSKIVICVWLLLSASATIAEDLGSFGISNPELAEELWEEAERIAYPNGIPRGEDMEELVGIELLQEAFRSDPDATLALIERMLRAGETSN